MYIRSTRRFTNESTQTKPEPTTPGVILATDGNTGTELDRLGRALYIFPPTGTNQFSSSLTDLLKEVSVAVANQIHPKGGAVVRTGWAVYGATKLITDCQAGKLDAYEVISRGGKVALDAFSASGQLSSSLPTTMSSTKILGAVPEVLPSTWTTGIGFMVDVVDAAVEDKDPNTFHAGYLLDQSQPMAITRGLVELAMAARNEGMFEEIQANHFQVDVSTENPTND